MLCCTILYCTMIQYEMRLFSEKADSGRRSWIAVAPGPPLAAAGGGLFYYYYYCN